LPAFAKRPARIHDYVRTAREAAADLGERPVAIGHSLGGFVAQHLAAEGRLAGAVLVASPEPTGLGATLWRLSSGGPEALAALLVAQAGGGPLLGPAAVRRILFSEDTPEDWVTAVAPVPRPESAAALLDATTCDLPFWPTARLTPMLAVQGDRDALVPISDLWALAAICCAEMHVMRGRGHRLPIDPAWRSLAWRINAWLSERAIGLERRARPACVGAAR